MALLDYLDELNCSGYVDVGDYCGDLMWCADCMGVKQDEDFEETITTPNNICFFLFKTIRQTHIKTYGLPWFVVVPRL